MYSNPFAPIQILTGDTRKACGFRSGRLHDERWSLQRKSRIERRFESQVAGRSPVCFLVTFCTTQKVTSRSLRRELRGFANLDSAHPNYKIARTKLKPSQRGLRGFANLDSARRNGGFALTKLNPLPLRGSVPAGTARFRVLFPLPLAAFFGRSAATPTFCKVQKVGQKTL